MSHLVVAPILLPLMAGAVMLLFDEKRRRLKQILTLAVALAQLVIALILLRNVTAADAGQEPIVYLLGNWQAPFGIVLVADRLSVLMLLLTSFLGLTSLTYALARWDRASPRFHSLFLFQLVGLNGAFLTGDLVNLFVFFELLLAASYGLALHGAGIERTRASLHYIAINVATSLFFLIGVSTIYSVTGTLNMAELADRIAAVPASDRMLLQSGAAILGIAFLVKAALWPLNFWLPATYSASAAPVAAMFAIMSKVGIYVVLRLTSLVFGEETGALAGFDDWLVYGGIATIVFGMVALLSSKTLTGVVGYYVLISSGTLIAAIGLGGVPVVAGLLFYLVSSTLAVSAFFLIIEPVERYARDEITDHGEPVFADEYAGVPTEEEKEIGVVIPGTIAILGAGFAFCALLISGMPPMSGFLAKFALIHGLLREEAAIDASVWLLIGLVILSGLVALIATTRAGIDILWTPPFRPQPNLALAEAIPIGLVLAACLTLVIGAGPVLGYAERTAAALGNPALYIDAVYGAPRVAAGPSAEEVHP
jgi:multicomponent K+:H+ antiporter subunit D